MKEVAMTCGRLAGTFTYMLKTQLAFRMACALLVCVLSVMFLAVRSSMAHSRIDQVEQQLSNCIIVQKVE